MMQASEFTSQSHVRRRASGGSQRPPLSLPAPSVASAAQWHAASAPCAPACVHVARHGSASARRKAAPQRRHVTSHALQSQTLTDTQRMEEAATKLASFCAVLQADGEGLTDSQLADLLGNVPGVLEEEPSAVRAKLEIIASSTGLSFVEAATLVTRVPAAWNR